MPDETANEENEQQEEPQAEAGVEEAAPEVEAEAAEPEAEAAEPEPEAEEAAPEAEAEEPAAEAEEPAAEAVAEPEPSAPAQPARKPKRKRLPRSQRHKHVKPKRERTSATRPSITRLPKPEHVRGRSQERRGVVVSDAMDKTIVVKVDTVKAHRKYKKVVRRSTRFHAHDEQNAAKVGDLVRIVETRPLSRTKYWRLAEVLEEAK